MVVDVVCLLVLLSIAGSLAALLSAFSSSVCWLSSSKRFAFVALLISEPLVEDVVNISGCNRSQSPKILPNHRDSYQMPRTIFKTSLGTAKKLEDSYKMPQKSPKILPNPKDSFKIASKNLPKVPKNPQKSQRIFKKSKRIPKNPQ